MEEISAGTSVGRNELLDPWAGGFGVRGFAATSCSWVVRFQIYVSEGICSLLSSPGYLNGHLELGGKEELVLGWN